MSQDGPPTEQVLCAAYERQAADYAAALRLADDLLADRQQDGNPGTGMARLHALVENIARTNAALAGPRQEWLQSGRKPGPLLDAALQTVARLIRDLGDRVRDLEQRVTARQNQLVPELDRLLRGRQMQQAYATATQRRHTPRR
jgi:hypothetical protein